MDGNGAVVNNDNLRTCRKNTVVFGIDGNGAAVGKANQSYVCKNTVFAVQSQTAVTLEIKPISYSQHGYAVNGNAVAENIVGSTRRVCRENVFALQLNGPHHLEHRAHQPSAGVFHIEVVKNDCTVGHIRVLGVVNVEVTALGGLFGYDLAVIGQILTEGEVMVANLKNCILGELFFTGVVGIAANCAVKCFLGVFRSLLRVDVLSEFCFVKAGIAFHK